MVWTLRPAVAAIQRPPANAGSGPAKGRPAGIGRAKTAAAAPSARFAAPDTITNPSGIRARAYWYTFRMAAWKRTGFVCALVYLCGLLSCSSSPPGETAARTSRASANAPTKAAQTAIGNWVAGALRSSQSERDPTRALQIAEHAVSQAPNRAELVWLAARLCADVPGCEPERYEARLRKLDPGNGVVWMGPLARAQAKNDSAAELQILEALSREDRFDVYWNVLLREGALAVSAQNQNRKQLLNGPLTNALNEVAAWLTAVAMPSFTGLANTCTRERAVTPETAQRCNRIANVLQRGDTFAAEAVGLGIAQRVVPDNSPSKIAIAERVDTVTYQHDTARTVMNNQVEREKLSAELIELMGKVRREQDVSLAVLRWARLPLEP